MEETPSDTYSKAEVDAKFEEIYAMIAELKVADKTEEEVVEMAAEEDSVQLRMSKIDKISKFLTKK